MKLILRSRRVKDLERVISRAHTGPVDELLVGADVGGTATRVAVAGPDGVILAVAGGGPGNPNVVGPATSAATLRALVEQVLAGLSGEVTGVVLGMAGGSRLTGDAGFLRSTVPARVGVRPRLVSDLAVAFCSATPEPVGCVLVAGTGAVAGRVSGSSLGEQRGGWGWLLGDEGGGFWLGRAAVRATLAALQQDQAPGPLHRAVLADVDAADYLGLLQWCYGRPPIALAALAPLVSEHAGTDPVATGIAAEAVDLLLPLLLDLRPGPAEPLVLAGSVVAPGSPVGTALRSALAARRTGPALAAADGVVGALWLALGDRTGGDAAVHARLRSTAVPCGRA